MNPDLTGIVVIAIIGLALIGLSLICHISRTPRPSRHRGNRPKPRSPADITLGFRDPFR